ncbi:MAG: N-acetylmuramoyl-L-alanine amidase, partial [Anaerolineae bacterium]
MRRYLRTLVGLFLALGCLICVPPPRPGDAADGAQTRAEEWLQTEASDFAAGALSNLRVLEEGGGALALASDAQGYASSGLYTSTVRPTDILFNAVGVQWHAEVPEGTDLRVAVRVGSDGTTWSPWEEVVEPQRDGSRLYAPMPVMVEDSRYLQYRLEFSSGQPALTPRLDDVTLTFIDSRGGPDLQAIQGLHLSAQPEGSGVPRPPFISRANWGANENYRFDSNGNEVWPTEYQTPQKIIIHHSVTLNNDPNPPATVRAIYYYHAITLGWGDVGYNYLVDWHGNIYEGRYGGLDVVGGHAYSYNYGSVGLCGMGTYGNTANSVAPSAELLGGLIDVSAWQCSRALIDPRESSFFVNKVTQNVAGHRDYNATACPGEYLYAQLPSIRSEAWGEIVEHTPVYWANYLSH